MTMQDILKDMKNTFGRSFITISEFSRYTRIGKDRARNMLTDIDFIKQGKTKTYFIYDLAKLLSTKKERY